MSDDHTPDKDPIDEAYLAAEAMLGEDAARAARRARVLAAVAREPATPPAPSSISANRARPYGGWLAAACVAGLSLFVVTRIYQPPPRLERTAPAAAIPAPLSPTAPPRRAAAREPPAPAPSKTPEAPAAPRTATQTPAAPGALVPPNIPAPPPLAIMPPDMRAPPPPPPPPPEASVTANLGYSSGGTAADAQGSVGYSARASAGRVAEAPVAVARPELGARLRAAAAAGQANKVETLLNQGAPVDAPDADGNTALMVSVHADNAAIAAILRRHGASLDLKNLVGESARDMATAKGDPALDHALGLDR